MSDYLHRDLGYQAAGTIVEVELDTAANVQLVDGPNLQNYRNQRDFRYSGGYAQESPYRVQVPHAGHWHVVIDFGGGSGSIRASVTVYPRAA